MGAYKITLILWFLLIPLCGRSQANMDANGKAYVSDLGRFIEEERYQEAIQLTDSILLLNQQSKEASSTFSWSDEQIETLLLWYVKTMAYAGIADAGKSEYLKRYLNSGMDRIHYFKEQNREFAAFASQKFLEMSEQMIERYTKGETAPLDERLTAPSPNPYFNYLYTVTNVQAKCMGQVDEAHKQALKELNAEDIEYQIRVILTNLLYWYHNKQTVFDGYYHRTDFKHLLLDAQTSMPDHTTNSSEKNPSHIDALLAICQFDFSDQSFTHTMQRINNDLARLTADDYFYMANNVYVDEESETDRNKRYYTAMTSGQKGNPDGWMMASFFSLEGYGCKADTATAIMQIEYAYQMADSASCKALCYQARYAYLTNNAKETIRLLDQVKDQPGFNKYGGALLYGQALEKTGTNKDHKKILSYYVDATQHSMFSHDIRAAYACYTRLRENQKP